MPKEISPEVREVMHRALSEILKGDHPTSEDPNIVRESAINALRGTGLYWAAGLTQEKVEIILIYETKKGLTGIRVKGALGPVDFDELIKLP